MITILKDYLKATVIIVRTSDRIFDRLEEIAPYLHSISTERREECVKELQNMIIYQDIQLVFLTKFNSHLLETKIFSKLKAKTATKCYRALVGIEIDQVTKKADKLTETNLSAETIKAALALLKEANDAAGEVVRSIIEEFRNDVLRREGAYLTVDSVDQFLESKLEKFKN